jgi:hypothetical protein
MSSSHSGNIQAGHWATLYKGASSGFFYLWSDRPVSVHWKIESASAPFYLEGTQNVNGKVAVPYGSPTPYVQVEVNPNIDSWLRVS